MCGRVAWTGREGTGRDGQRGHPLTTLRIARMCTNQMNEIRGVNKREENSAQFRTGQGGSLASAGAYSYSDCNAMQWNAAGRGRGENRRETKRRRQCSEMEGVHGTESDLVAEVGEQVDAARAGGLAHGPEEAEHREHVVVAVFEVRRKLLLDRLGHRQRQRLRTSTSLQ